MVVYHSKKHDLTVTFTCRDHMATVVDVSLGSEVRLFKVGEFTNSWVTMLEEERKATSAYLASLELFVWPEKREKGLSYFPGMLQKRRFVCTPQTFSDAQDSSRVINLMCGSTD